MTALASDNFTRANAANLGASWTPNTTVAGHWQIVSNTAQAALVTGSYRNADAFYSGGGISWPNDQYSSVTISSITGTFPDADDDGPGPIVRRSSTPATMTMYAVFLDTSTNGNVSLNISDSGGSFTNLGRATATLNVGDVITLSVQGTTLKVLQNGIQILTATDSTLSSGVPGMFNSGDSGITSAAFSYWEGGSLVANQSLTVNQAVKRASLY
jgi:hypothetical protein